MQRTRHNDKGKQILKKENHLNFNTPQSVSLDRLYDEIAQNSSRWSYYQHISESIVEKWNDNDAALNFIKKYFIDGGKQAPVDFNIGDVSIKERARHAISTYLLGIRFAEMFGILPCDNQTNEVNDPYDKDGFNFKYYWFLACLYHDVGYVYENGTYLNESIKGEQKRKNKLQDNLSALRTDGLEAIQEICDIRYLHDRVFKTYDRSEIDLYLKGRATCCNCIDHGIAGGLMLYDKLRKQFEQSWQNRDRRRSFDRTNFWNNKTGLHLSNSHFEEYAKAANAIIAHNIWIDTLNNYKQFVKTPLVTKNRISFHKDPLCFILSLADTLEPLKKNIGLNCIKLGCGNDINSFIIEISADVEKRNKYIDCVKKLSEWLDVTVEKCGNCRAIISVDKSSVGVKMGNEKPTKQTVPAKKYLELLGTAICVFNLNNAFIIENILRTDNTTNNWYDLVDLTSGVLRRKINDTISQRAGNDIAELFSELVEMRNRIIHSFQITAENGEQMLATKTRKEDGNRQFRITEDYLMEFIQKNDILSDKLHEYRRSLRIA